MLDFATLDLPTRPAPTAATGPARPVVLRFAGLSPQLLHRFTMHDRRRGGDVRHVNRAATGANRVLHGDPDWDAQLRVEIEQAREANHAQVIRARRAKGREKEAKELERQGPSDPWRASRTGPLREGILTAHKSYFGGAGRAAWDDEKAKHFKERALQFLRTHFPDDQLLYVSAHEDEESYHLHFTVAVWVTKTSANSGQQRMLQPSANPLLKRYEHAQDLAGEAFADLGLLRGEKRAAARRTARDKGEPLPVPKNWVPPSE